MAIKSYLNIVAGILFATAIVVATAAMFIPRLLDLDTYRAQILALAQKSLHRPVAYESAAFSWHVGPSFVFKGITVKEKSGEPAFIEADQLTLKLALLPLFHKEVRLREIVLERPVLLLDRNQAGVFNIDDLLTGTPSTFTVRLKKIRIMNGLVRFTDRFSHPEAFTTSLENLDLQVSNLTRGKTTGFKLSAVIPENKGRTEVSITGTAGIAAPGKPLSETKIDAALSAKNLDAGRYWPYYGRYLPFEQIRGSLDLEGTFRGDMKAFATKGHLRVRDLRFKYPRVFHATLTPKEIQLAYDMELTPSRFSVNSLDLVVDGLRVRGSCDLADIHSDDLRITARAATSPFRLEEFRQYIPYGVIVKGTADFIEEHITGGIFQLDEGKLDGRVSQILHMERNDNYNALFIRGRVEKGRVTFGQHIPTFTNINGDLEMRGKDFVLSRMTGNFGGSPFTLEGKIADYPLDTPAGYPFTMTMIPAQTEVAWLLGQDKPLRMALSGASVLRLSGSGTASDYGLTGSWDLSPADYQYPHVVRKPAGLTNRLRFSARLGKTEARLTELRYELPPLELTASATYRYADKEPLSFAVTTNRFTVGPHLPIFPGLQEYRPSGSLQAAVRGTGNPAVTDGIRWRGEATLAGCSAQPLVKIKPVTDINGTIHFTEAGLETEQLAGRLGDSAFTVKGRVTGFANPAANLIFSSPGLHPQDLGYVAPGAEPEVKKLAGGISLKDGKLVFTNVSGEVNRSIFTVNGEIIDIGKPKITLRADFPFLRVEDMAPLIRLEHAGGEVGHSRGLMLNARVTSGAGSVRDIPFTKLATELSLENDHLAIQELRVGAWGGTITGSGFADLAAAGGPTYQGHYHLDRLDAAQLPGAAGAQRHVSGVLVADGELAARGNSLEELQKTARGSAAIELSNGVINSPAGAEGGTAHDIPFKTVQSRLSFAGDVVDIHSARIDAFDGVISGKGTVDFSIPDGPGFQVSCHLDALDAAQFLTAFGATKDISGRLTLQGELIAQGDTTAALKKTVQGSIGMHLEKGVINKYPLLSKVFSFLNVSQLLDFRLPDMVSAGMPYDHIDGTFFLKDGIVSTSDLSIHSPSLNVTIVGTSDIVNREVDVKIGVQPFQTVGKIVSRIPVFGWILTGRSKRLLVTYFEAKGSWGDPTVKPIPVTSLSNEDFDIFKRTFSLPSDLFTDTGNVILGN